MTSTTGKSHTGRNVVALLLVIAILVIFLFYVVRGGSTPLTGLAYPNVAVSGNVNTVGAGTSPTRIDFTSDTGQVYSADVSSHSYSITLPNQHSYSVTVAWTGFGGIGSGTCNGGTLNLNLNAGSTTYNTSC